MASTLSPNLVVLDVRLPGIIEIVEELQRMDETTCIIILTPFGRIPAASTSTRLDASHYLSKQSDADQILKTFERVTAADFPGE